MSSRVRLVCYPRTDVVFSANKALRLKIELPDGYPAGGIVREIQDRLRESYPRAVIEVEDAPGIDGLSTWHAYRDGILADS